MLFRLVVLYAFGSDVAFGFCCHTVRCALLRSTVAAYAVRCITQKARNFFCTCAFYIPGWFIVLKIATNKRMTCGVYSPYATCPCPCYVLLLFTTALRTTTTYRMPTYFTFFVAHALAIAALRRASAPCGITHCARGLLRFTRFATRAPPRLLRTHRARLRTRTCTTDFLPVRFFQLRWLPRLQALAWILLLYTLYTRLSYPSPSRVLFSILLFSSTYPLPPPSLFTIISFYSLLPTAYTLPFTVLQFYYTFIVADYCCLFVLGVLMPRCFVTFCWCFVVVLFGFVCCCLLWQFTRCLFIFAVFGLVCTFYLLRLFCYSPTTILFFFCSHSMLLWRAYPVIHYTHSSVAIIGDALYPVVVLWSAIIILLVLPNSSPLFFPTHIHTILLYLPYHIPIPFYWLPLPYYPIVIQFWFWRGKPTLTTLT